MSVPNHPLAERVKTDECINLVDRHHTFRPTDFSESFLHNLSDTRFLQANFSLHDGDNNNNNNNNNNTPTLFILLLRPKFCAKPPESTESRNFCL
jgi:hypothetical protein